VSEIEHQRERGTSPARRAAYPLLSAPARRNFLQ
jgi:hypothetical protein